MKRSWKACSLCNMMHSPSETTNKQKAIIGALTNWISGRGRKAVLVADFAQIKRIRKCQNVDLNKRLNLVKPTAGNLSSSTPSDSVKASVCFKPAPTKSVFISLLKLSFFYLNTTLKVLWRFSNTRPRAQDDRK